MPLINVVIVLIVVGILLWLLNVFGLFTWLPHIRVGS